MDNKYRVSTFHKLMKTFRSVANRTHESLDTIGLFRGQPPLLMSLWDKDCQSRRELCDHLGSKPATVTKMVKRLQNNDFVSSQSDKDDSRISRVCLTQKGKAIESPVNEIYFELQATAFKDFSNDEIMEFNRLLDKIRSNVSRGGEASHE